MDCIAGLLLVYLAILAVNFTYLVLGLMLSLQLQNIGLYDPIAEEGFGCLDIAPWFGPIGTLIITYYVFIPYKWRQKMFGKNKKLLDALKAEIETQRGKIADLKQWKEGIEVQEEKDSYLRRIKDKSLSFETRLYYMEHFEKFNDNSIEYKVVREFGEDTVWYTLKEYDYRSVYDPYIDPDRRTSVCGSIIYTLTFPKKKVEKSTKKSKKKKK